MAERVSGLIVNVAEQAASPNVRVADVAVQVAEQAAPPHVRVSGVFVMVAESIAQASAVPDENPVAAFTDEDGLSVVATITLPDVNPVGAFTDDTGLTVGAPEITYPPPVNPVVSFSDTGGFNFVPRLYGVVRIVAAFADDGGLSVAAPKFSPPDAHPAAAFTDDSVLRANPNVITPYARTHGPFFFAWVDDDEIEFVAADHARDDEDVFSLEITQTEGEFASATVVIRNPQIGLLAPSRKRWAWMSFYDRDNDKVIPLFFGRLKGVPDNIFDKQVSIVFTARPKDFVAQKAALAQSLRVLPYWEPIFLDEKSWTDDDVVLEARSALWHIDRVSHQVSITDYLVGEDGEIAFYANKVPRDSLAISMASPPLRAVTVNAEVPWKQTAAGALDLAPLLLGTWPYEHDSNFAKMITSFTIDGLISDWPKPDSKIGDGWKVLDGSLENMTYTVGSRVANIGFFDIHSDNEYLIEQNEKAIRENSEAAKALPYITPGSATYPKIYNFIGQSGPFSSYAGDFGATLGYARPVLKVIYDAERDLSESVSLTMYSDMQEIITAPEDDEALVLTLNANSISDPTYDGTIPLGSLDSRGFSHTDRGRLAIEHLVLLARANLIARARAVEVSWKGKIIDALDISLRKNARIFDDRLAGGQASGKIKEYTLSISGSSGIGSVSVKIGCSVGKGGTVSGSVGEPTYCEEAYCGDDYQAFTGGTRVAAYGDVTFDPPDEVPFDDGLNFRRGLGITDVVRLVQYANTPTVQRQKMNEACKPNSIAVSIFATPAAPADEGSLKAVLDTYPTQISVKLRPMSGGPFVGGVPITVSDLVLPKQIDLEAEHV